MFTRPQTQTDGKHCGVARCQGSRVRFANESVLRLWRTVEIFFETLSYHSGINLWANSESEATALLRPSLTVPGAHERGCITVAEGVSGGDASS